LKRLLLLLAALIVVLAAAVFSFRPRGLGEGPVSAGTGTSSSGQRLAIGERVSFGYVLLTNSGNKPATLESVRLLGVSGGLELLGIRSRTIPDEQGRGMFIGLSGFPPNEWSSTPLDTNHVVPVPRTFSETGNPNEGLELVIGVRATRPGVARARAVEFTYRVDDRRYRGVYEGSMYLCAPVENFTAETCPGEAEGKFDDVDVEVKIPSASSPRSD
jgi:hypothetical protein